MTKDKALKLILEWSNYEAHVLPKELHKAVEEALAQPNHSCPATGVCALSSTLIEPFNIRLPALTVIFRSDK